MKKQNLHAVDAFSSSTNTYSANQNGKKSDLDEQLIDLYAPDPYLSDIPKKDINISIKFSIPSDLIIEEKLKEGLGWIRKRTKSVKAWRLSQGRRRLLFGSIVALAATIFIAGTLLPGNPPQNTPSEVKGASTSPKFTALAPGGDTSSQFRYDNKREVISSSHNLKGIDIILSQQVLPEAFRGNPQNNVLETAKRFNATKEIKAGETTAYAGKSADGPQTILFHKNDILVFIYSPIELDNETLAAFIENLQ